VALPEQRLRTMHLFAGAGGGILGDLILGHVPVCAVEIEEYPRKVLLARQRDGILPRFPIWDDVTSFDGVPWRGRVDIVAGGFPCQDISAAGKGAGLAGARSGLWSEMARIVCEVGPHFVFVENSPLLVSRGLDVVLGDLAAMGYDARWGVVSAGDVGARHKRERLWIVADSAKVLQLEHQLWARKRLCKGPENLWLEPSASLLGGFNAVAGGVDRRRRAIGNGQVPAVAALAWRILTATEKATT